MAREKNSNGMERIGRCLSQDERTEKNKELVGVFLESIKRASEKKVFILDRLINEESLEGLE